MQNSNENTETRQNRIHTLYDELRYKQKAGIKCITSSGASLPYSIFYEDDAHAYIQVAVAGYRRDDISVHKKGDVLSVSTSYASCGLKEVPEPDTDIHYHFKTTQESRTLGNVYYVYKGITNKEFNMNFLIPTGHEVGVIDIKDGILSIKIELTSDIWVNTQKLF